MDLLLGDPRKAAVQLGWQPLVKFHELARIMVNADLELLDLDSPSEGQRIIAEEFGSWHRWEEQVGSMGR